MPRLQKELKTGRARIEFELDEQEYAAIGRVTAQWAYLEHGIFAVSKAISEVVGVAIPSDALSTSFSRRLRALRLLVETYGPDDERKRMTKLFGKIANAEQDRHRVTHAMWDWDKSNPERVSASSFRPGYEFEKLFDATKLHKLADRIGEISFALEYPEGWDSAFMNLLANSADADGQVVYAGFSRQFHREVVARRATASDPDGSNNK